MLFILKFSFVVMKEDCHQFCVVHSVSILHFNPHLLYFSQIISICVGTIKWFI